MKKIRTTTLVLLTALFMAALMTSCAAPAETNPSGPAPANPPEQTVQAFYDWYADWSEGPRQAEDSGYLTDSFAAELAGRAPAAKVPVFVCGQDIPNLTVNQGVVEGSKATVLVDPEWGSDLEIGLVAVGGEWKIESARCLPE